MVRDSLDVGEADVGCGSFFFSDSLGRITVGPKTPRL